MVELLYPSGCKEGYATTPAFRRRTLIKLTDFHCLCLQIEGSTLLSMSSVMPSSTFSNVSSLGQRVVPNSSRDADYIPPSHQAKFGNLPNALDFIDKPPTPASQLNSPNPDRLATPDESETPVPETNAVPSETIADAVRKSLARNRKDGPAFLRAMNRYNTAMAELIADGSISTWMETRPKLTGEEWSNLVDKVHEQAYARVVGPYSEQLEVSRPDRLMKMRGRRPQHHPKHTDEVSRAIIDIEDSYGELRHRSVHPST